MSEPQKISSWDEIDAPQKVSSWDEVDNDVKKKDVTTPTPKPLQQNGSVFQSTSPSILNVGGKQYTKAPLIEQSNNSNLGFDVTKVTDNALFKSTKENPNPQIPVSGIATPNDKFKRITGNEFVNTNYLKIPNGKTAAETQQALQSDKLGEQLAGYLTSKGKDLTDFDPIEFKNELKAQQGTYERPHIIGKEMHQYKSDEDAYNKVGSILQRNVDLTKSEIDAKYGQGAYDKYEQQLQQFNTQYKQAEPQITAIDAQLETLQSKKPRTVEEMQSIKQQFGDLQQQREQLVGGLAQQQQQLQQFSTQPEFQKLSYLQTAQNNIWQKQQKLLDKYPDVKSTFESNEKTQKWIDENTKALKAVNPQGAVVTTLLGDALSKITDFAHKLSAIPEIGEKALGIENSTLLTPFDFATGLINDATAKVSDKAKNLVPSNMELPVSQKYKVVNGNKIFLDKNDKPMFVRDIDGYKVDPKVEQQTLEQYNATPYKTKIPVKEKTDLGVLLNESAKFGMDIAGMGQIGSGLSTLGLAGNSAKAWANGTLTLMGYGLNDAYENARVSAPNLTDQQAAQYALGSQAAIGSVFGLLGGAKMKYITGEGGESIFSKVRNVLQKDKAFNLSAEDIRAIDSGASAYDIGKKRVQKAIGEALLQGGEMGIIMPTLTATANKVTNTLAGYKAMDDNLDISKESLKNSALPAMLVGAITGGMSVSGSNIKSEAWSKINKNDQTANATIDFLDKSVEQGLYTPEQADKIKERIKYTQDNLKPLNTIVDDNGKKVLSNLYDAKFQLQEQADKFTDSGAKKAYTDKIRAIDNDIAQVINGKNDFQSNVSLGILDGINQFAEKNNPKESVFDSFGSNDVVPIENKTTEVPIPEEPKDITTAAPASEMSEEAVNQLYEEKIANPTVEEEQNPFLDKLRKKTVNEAEITPNELVEQGGEQNVGEGLQGEYQNNQGVQQGSGIGQVSGQEVPTEKVEEGINAIQESSKKESAFDIVAKEEEIARKKQQADKDKALLDIELIKSGDTETIDKYFKKSGYKEITGNETDTRLKGKKGVYKNTGASIIIKKSKTDAALDSAINISNKKIQGLSNSRIEEIVKEFQSKQPPISKTETTENPALKDVEATAKALEGVDVVQHLRDKTNALRDEQGNIPKDKMEKFKALRKASGAVNDGLVQIPESNYENTGRSKKFTPKQISEAYHKAKADGSNPELVKAVEEALTPTPEVSKPVSEIAKTPISKTETTKEGSGVGGDVKVPILNEEPLQGKELIADALDRIANKIGSKKNLTEQEKTSLTKDVTDLARGLIQMGKATLDNVVDKIKEEIRKRLPDLDDKTLNSIAENIEDKVLLGEAVNWYKDKGYTYEQAKARLDKIDADYNDADLREMFNGKTEPQELIGTKNAMTEQEMERMGITPPEKLKSKPYQEQIKVAREGIDNGTVDPYTIVEDILSTENIEDTAIKPSYEPALQLHLVDLKNKVNVANDRIIEIEKQLQKEPDNLELQGEISDLNAQIIQAETDREQALMAAQKAGTVWGNYGQNRQNVIDLQDIVQAKINRIRALYNGEPPKEVKEKLESLQRENDRLEAENRRITKEFNESQQQQDTAEFQKQLQQEYERGLVEGGNKASYQKRAKSIADSVRKLKTKPPVLKDANGNEIKITQNALFPTASWNDAVEILAKSIETAGTFADGLANGIEKVKKHLESYGWYSKLSDKDKESVVGLVKDSISAKDEQNKRLKIPRGYLKDIIESKGITDINKLVEEVKNDYPDKSDREIRDAITGYGVTSEPSSEPVDVALRKMNRKGRILSALEDLDEGIRPDRSGAKRDVLEDDERADLKKIRDGIKELPQSDEDLSKKMKSAQDAIETRIKNRIADIKLILDGKAKDTKSNKVEDTEDITKLRDEKEQWEQKLVDFKAKNKQSDALDAIQKLADKNGSTTVSKEMVTNGHIKDVITSQIQDGVPLKDIAENTVNLLKPILPDITQKDVTDALLKKGNFATEKTTKKDLQIQLSDLKAQLNLKEKIANLENGIIQKTKEKGATSDEVKELQKQLAETKQRAKNGFADISSAELERQIKATQNKIDKGEYFKIPVDKKTFENDKQWLENKKRLDDIKKKLNILEQNARESKKTTAMIIADVVTQNIGRRLVFFGSQAYQVKLSVAAFTTLLTKLPKEVLGQVFTTMFPKIGKDAQIEGSFDLGAVGKFYGEALNPLKLAKGTANIALTGKNTLDQTLETHPERQYTLAKLRDDYNADYAWYAKYPKIVASIMSSNHIPGLDLLTTDPHVMIKDPIKRGSYEFAFMKIMNHYKSLGMELNNPLLIGMAQDAAFRYAKAEIFMGSGLDKSGKRKDPSFTDKINAYFNSIENSAIEEANKKGGNQVSAHSKYALVKLYNFLYPVVGVPSRILGTVVKSNPISFSKDLMSAAIINRKVTKGIESLSNNQADMIIRQLKEGAIGSAMWTLGFVATMNMLKKQDEERKKNKLKLGGYYTGYIDKKDRIRENLLQPNDFIINNDGHDKYLTHNAQHSTAVMAIQAGATLATLFYHFNNPHLDYKAIETDGVKRYQRVIAQDDKASSVKKATVGLAGSLADQHPIVQTSYDIYESTQTDKGREAYIRNIKNRLDVKKKAQKLKDGILDLNFFEDTPGH